MNISLIFHEQKLNCAFSDKNYIQCQEVDGKTDGWKTKHEGILEISIMYRILDEFDKLPMQLVY